MASDGSSESAGWFLFGSFGETWRIMKVLFLGAGASISAGYPSTSELLESVLADAGASPSVSDKGCGP